MIPSKPFNITVIQVYTLTTNAEVEVEQFYEDIQDHLELTPKKKKKKKDVLFITGNWNAKVGSQEIPGVTDKFGLGVQDEAGQRLTQFCQENSHGHHQIVNTEIRLPIFFAVEEDALYSQQKQDQELPVAQIRNSLLSNPDLN